DVDRQRARERLPLHRYITDRQGAVALRPGAEIGCVDMADGRDVVMRAEDREIARAAEAATLVTVQHGAVERDDRRLQRGRFGEGPRIADRDDLVLAGHAFDEVDGPAGGNGACLAKTAKGDLRILHHL